jgi:PAS domain S-box-containing protein
MNDLNSGIGPIELEQQIERPKSPLNRLIIGLLLMVVVAGSLGAFQLYHTRTQLLQQAETNSQALAEILQKTIGAMMQKTDMTLLHVADEVARQFAAGGIQSEELRAFIERQFRLMPELDSLRISDANGIVILGSGHLPTVSVSINDRDYFTYLRDHADAGMVVSKPLLGKISKKWVVTCVRRITLKNGTFGGVVFAALPLQQFNELFKGVPVGPRGTISLRSADLTVIARYSATDDEKNELATGSDTVSEAWQTLLKRKLNSGSYTAASITDGVRRVHSYSRTTNYPLYVNIGLAEDDVLSEARQEIFALAGAFAAFLLMGGVLIRLVDSNWHKTVTAEKMLKRNYERLELMQEVSQHHAYTVQELLDFSLEKVIALTDSNIGYIYHYNEDRQEFVLNTWSKNVMPACNVAEPQSLYQLEKTGIWGEVVRQRKPIVVNEYAAANPLKKGCPEGHVPLSRFLSIPVFDKESIVAVVGVANKTLPYDETDVLQLSLMMEGVWKIAARLMLEEHVLKAGHEWQSTFDSINDSISLIATDQRIIRCNLATTLLLGREFSDIIGQPCWKLFHDSNAPIDDCPMVKARLSLHSETSTIKHMDRWLEVTVDPIVSGQDVLTGAVHIVRDVTEQITLNNSIKEINDLFTLFMKHSPIYTFIKEVTDTESRVLQVSNNFRDMVGIKAHDMIGKNMHQLFPTEFADKITADDQRVVASKDVLRLEEFFNDGSYITYKFPIDRADGRHLLAGYTIDITDRKRLETELIREKSLYEDLVNTQPAGMYRLRVKPVKACDANGWRDVVESHYSVDVVSARFCEIIGMDMEAFKEKPGLIVDLIFPEDRVDFTEKNALALTNLTPFKWEGRFVENNNGIRWIRFESTPRLLDNMEVLWTGVVSNITEQKLSELNLRNLQTQLMQNDKLSTIGQLAAGVAHEINNPIGFVSSNMMTLAKYVEKYNYYIELLENEIRNYSNDVLPDNILETRKSMKLDYVIKDITVLLDENNEGIERVKRIVSDLRTFSRSDTLAMSSADLNSCMDSTINIVINEIKYSAELNRHYGNLPKVSCNIQQISQVFMNLLINATHAIQAKGEEVGEIVIRTWCDQNSVFVSVSDNGCGIAPENCSKIFDAFFTTKDIGKGTGLGLSISAGIVRKHSGEITLTSELGVGSTFTVRLPLKQTEKSGIN